MVQAFAQGGQETAQRELDGIKEECSGVAAEVSYGEYANVFQRLQIVAPKGIGPREFLLIMSVNPY